ncbi:MAG: hypothetical protein HY080_14450 [Gammaproteobacteria bacterium]|nr:hypothetical protein [Gammaproteobacteria bacterium]
MIVVIAVLGLIMAGTATYITNGVTAYSNTVRRDDLAASGRVTVERLTRELRTALPNSVRVSNNCLEFLPIQTGSAYLTLPIDVAASSFTAAAFSLPGYSGTRYAVVYPYTPTNLYTTTNPSPTAVFSSVTGSPTATITLGSSHRFSDTSPQQRFFIVGSPVSFCLVGSQLNRYSGYGLNSVQATPPANGVALLAENLQSTDNGVAVTPFTYTPGTLKRNAIVSLDLRWSVDNDWMRLTHEVQLRNVM